MGSTLQTFRYFTCGQCGQHIHGESGKGTLGNSEVGPEVLFMYLKSTVDMELCFGGNICQIDGAARVFDPSATSSYAHVSCPTARCSPCVSSPRNATFSLRRPSPTCYWSIRDSDLTVSSKLIFGEDDSLSSHPNLNYTSFAAGKENSSVDTFYYVRVKEIRIGGEALSIPEETWTLNGDGTGGTIIDSGTTLSYFIDPAYDLIRQTFIGKVKYPMVADFPVLSPCYNVTGVDNVEMPGFGIVFGDGARWDFPVENYFIRLEPEGIMCLAILGTPRSSLSIIGNYQQQNFHVVYDTEKSRLGFAPMRCADV
ncbi:aspartic proteinase nepenthesin-1-like [Asparagus officinalis]|uniref:aspartic proteinase nepenthesin-1-like n=1 Tax=Asparagus officinalis TaxID=4686 RepID=UPI00098DFC7F|nr:aspartic proteinase nepenthesin-1-like [Asparagus officinalis]